MSKVTVDASTCIGCGLCEQMCPEIFGLEDNIAVVKANSCADHNLQDIIDQCPVTAIAAS